MFKRRFIGNSQGRGAKDKNMNIALTYNVRHNKPSLENPEAMVEAEFDEPSTIEGIKLALEKLGHKPILIEADQEAYCKFKKLKSDIDLVFNIAEGLYGHDREAQIPAMLEMLKIPYVGSSPLAQAICLNKTLTKEILAYHKIPTPRFQLFKNINDDFDKNLRFPIIVKPNCEGSSKGIKQNCLVKNEKELRKKVKEIIESFRQGALAEEFLSGREFTVALVGNDPVEIFPLVEVDFSGLPEGLAPMDSYEVKWLVDNPASKIDTVICPAKVNHGLKKMIDGICLETKNVINIFDWCRIDIRLDVSGLPYVLEVNQTPGIIPDPKENSRFPLAARTAGYSYEEMLDKIIKVARKRCENKKL